MQILIAQNDAVSAGDLKMPTSQFTYEYEVLDKLLPLSKDIEMLKNKNDDLENVNNRLQTGRYLCLVNRP